jgi:hypothetical protein
MGDHDSYSDNVPIVQIVPERFDRLERLTCLNLLMSLTTRRMTPNFPFTENIFPDASE